MSLFRTEYRQLSDEEKALVAEIKAKAGELEVLVQKATQLTQASRYTSLAITHLEMAVMWAVKHITG